MAVAGTLFTPTGLAPPPALAPSTSRTAAVSCPPSLMFREAATTGCLPRRGAVPSPAALRALLDPEPPPQPYQRTRPGRPTRRPASPPVGPPVLADDWPHSAGNPAPNTPSTLRVQGLPHVGAGSDNQEVTLAFTTTALACLDRSEIGARRPARTAALSNPPRPGRTRPYHRVDGHDRPLDLPTIAPRPVSAAAAFTLPMTPCSLALGSHVRPALSWLWPV